MVKLKELTGRMIVHSFSEPSYKMFWSNESPKLGQSVFEIILDAGWSHHPWIQNGVNYIVLSHHSSKDTFSLAHGSHVYNFDQIKVTG